MLAGRGVISDQRSAISEQLSASSDQEQQFAFSHVCQNRQTWVADLCSWSAVHVVEDGADDAAEDARFGFAPLCWHVLHDLVGQAGDGEGLEPDAAGAGELREEEAIATEDHVAQAADHGDLKRDAALECADVSGVDEKCFAGTEIAHNQLAGELQPGGALAADLLQQEAGAAENARAEGLLESDADADARGGAEESVTMDHVFVAGGDFDRDDVAGHMGGKGQLAGAAEGAVLGHEEAAAADNPLQRDRKSTR